MSRSAALVSLVQPRDSGRGVFKELVDGGLVHARLAAPVRLPARDLDHVLNGPTGGFVFKVNKAL
jgi:hypothetical protein